MFEKYDNLKDYIGYNIQFEGFGINEGVLFESGGKLWLPFCGGVNAESVKIFKIY